MTARTDELVREILDWLQDHPEKRKNLRIAIDGPCAAGKSTLGAQLAQALSGQLVHMDDFFLQPKQRTPDRYQEPGGNVDRERFKKDVQEPLDRGQPARYQVFDCRQMKLTETLMACPDRPLVVEGSYSLHPDLRDFYNVRIFLHIPCQLQLARIRKRNPDQAEDFAARWIPLEEAYFEKFQPWVSCDLELWAD